MKNLFSASSVPFIAAFIVVGAVQAAEVRPGLNDAQISKIVLTANSSEIDAAKLAKKRTDNAEVKAFADMMIDAHTTVTDKTKAVAKNTKTKPEDSATSKSMEAAASENEKQLKKIKGSSEFDLAYADLMVANHQAVLDAIDNVLLPNAKGEQLKTLLKETRPSVATHLDHAKALQAKLNGKG